MKFDAIDKYIGNELKKERLKRNMSMEDVAKFIGLKGKQSYRSYETGRTSIPLPIYKNVCKLFSIDYVKLFEEAQAEMIKEIKK